MVEVSAACGLRSSQACGAGGLSTQVSPLTDCLGFLQAGRPHSWCMTYLAARGSRSMASYHVASEVIVSLPAKSQTHPGSRKGNTYPAFQREVVHVTL